MPDLINVAMLKHPINWLIIWVVITIAGFGIREIHKGISGCGCSGSDIPD